MFYEKNLRVVHDYLQNSTILTYGGAVNLNDTMWGHDGRVIAEMRIGDTTVKLMEVDVDKDYKDNMKILVIGGIRQSDIIEFDDNSDDKEYAHQKFYSIVGELLMEYHLLIRNEIERHSECDKSVSLEKVMNVYKKCGYNIDDTRPPKGRWGIRFAFFIQSLKLLFSK